MRSARGRENRPRFRCEPALDPSIAVRPRIFRARQGGCGQLPGNTRGDRAHAPEFGPVGPDIGADSPQTQREGSRVVTPLSRGRPGPPRAAPVEPSEPPSERPPRPTRTTKPRWETNIRRVLRKEGLLQQSNDRGRRGPCDQASSRAGVFRAHWREEPGRETQPTVTFLGQARESGLDVRRRPNAVVIPPPRDTSGVSTSQRDCRLAEGPRLTRCSGCASPPPVTGRARRGAAGRGGVRRYGVPVVPGVTGVPGVPTVPAVPAVPAVPGVLPVCVAGTTLNSYAPV